MRTLKKRIANTSFYLIELFISRIRIISFKNRNLQIQLVDFEPPKEVNVYKTI